MLQEFNSSSPTTSNEICDEIILWSNHQIWIHGTNTNNTIRPLFPHHIFTSTKKNYLELCRPSGQYPAINLVFPCSRCNNPHFPFPSILTGFISSLNAEAERLLWSIPPLTTHKIRIGVSLYTTRYSWSHAQHLLNIPTLHQLQASEVRWKLEFNPKEVGRA